MSQFSQCVKDGGKVKTRQIGKTEYQRVCILGKKLFPGEVQKRKSTIRVKKK